MKAVNSENEKNLASDAWRAMQLERSLSKPGHAYGKFGTGSSDTLEKEPKAKHGRDHETECQHGDQPGTCGTNVI